MSLSEKESMSYDFIEMFAQKTQMYAPIEIHFVDSIKDSWRQYVTSNKVVQDYNKSDIVFGNGLCMPFDGEKYHILIRNDHDELYNSYS